MKQIIQETQDLLGIKLSSYQISQLEAFAAQLSDWNERYSLTAIVEPDKVRVKHFLDSFSPYLVLKEFHSKKVIDIGTGAGFPGIPLKILIPHLEITLVDSVAKKVEFCQYAVNELALKDVHVVRGRVEQIARDADFREQYDWAVARAVAHLSTLGEYLLPLIRVGGKMLAMKGDRGPQEAQQAENAIRILGGELEQIQKVTLPGVVEDRYLIVVHKKAATPEKYPRRVGVPVKRPL